MVSCEMIFPEFFLSRHGQGAFCPEGVKVRGVMSIGCYVHRILYLLRVVKSRYLLSRVCVIH